GGPARAADERGIRNRPISRAAARFSRHPSLRPAGAGCPTRRFLMTATTSLAGRTIVMSGGSRGIGLAIALRAAADGANIVLLAKTAEPHPKLRGTVFEAVERIE